MSHADPHRGDASAGYCYVTSSQAGNPLACAAGLATLEELSRPGVIDSMHASAEHLKHEIADRIRHRGLDAQVVGAGPLWDVAFTAQPIFDHRSSLAADRRRLLAFHTALVRHGVMVRIGGRSYFSASHQSEEIDLTVRAVESALDEVR